eukprot:6858182-Alexandrium_andersonii.AAC.1
MGAPAISGWAGMPGPSPLARYTGRSTGTARHGVPATAGREPGAHEEEHCGAPAHRAARHGAPAHDGRRRARRG